MIFFSFSIDGDIALSISSFQSGILRPISSKFSPSFTNKRQFNNAFYSSIPATLDASPLTSSYQPGWPNNCDGCSNNYRSSNSGSNRFPKGSRSYNY